MRVVLATPPDSIKKRYNATIGADEGFLPPLGMGYLAAILKDAGHELFIIDAPPLKLDEEVVADRILAHEPDIIGLSIYTSVAETARSLAETLRKRTTAPIIAGGPHPTAMPQDLLQTTHAFDIAVVGEGDHTLKEVVENWDARRKGWLKSLHEIKGIAFRDCNTIKITPPRELCRLEELPLPERDLFDLKIYMPFQNQYKRLPVTNMMTSRGCPYGKCTYCFEARSTKAKYRRVSVNKAISETKLLINKYGIREIFFFDDSFTAGERWVLDFCKTLKQEKLDIVWSCYGMISMVRKEMLKAMAEVGCWNIFYGIESGVQHLLDKINKDFTLDDVRKVVRWTQEAGIEIRGSFMLGLPGETPELAEQTIRFAIELDLDYAQFCLTTPFPGTRLYEACKEEGFLEDNFSNFTVWNPVFVPKGYSSREELKEVHSKAFKDFYYRPRYILKTLKKVRSLSDLIKYYNGFKLVLGLSR